MFLFRYNSGFSIVTSQGRILEILVLTIFFKDPISCFYILNTLLDEVNLEWSPSCANHHHHQESSPSYRHMFYYPHLAIPTKPLALCNVNFLGVADASPFALVCEFHLHKATSQDDLTSAPNATIKLLLGPGVTSESIKNLSGRKLNLCYFLRKFPFATA